MNREKYCKTSQTLAYPINTKNIPAPNKYHQRTYQKTKKQIQKKNKCDNLWKKKSSYVYWNDKENDKNISNYNKKFYYNHKKKFCRYQKKLIEFDYSYNYEENNNNYKLQKLNENEDEDEIKQVNFQMEQDDSKEDISKEDKNNSIEYTTTTAYSNSNSGHEESNYNNSSSNELCLILNSKDSNQNNENSNTIYFSPNLDTYQFYPRKYSAKEKSQEFNTTTNDKINDINNQLFSNSMKSLNLLRLNSCPTPGTDKSSLSTSKITKVHNSNKYPDNNSSDSFNKYNSINPELNQLWLNPVAENTEILSVCVKVGKNKNAVFKLRRFDDLFLTVKLFCEINSINEKLMKPIIIKALSALNTIYQVYNSTIDSKNIEKLKMMNNFINSTYI